jgi:hypothetical protein
MVRYGLGLVLNLRATTRPLPLPARFPTHNSCYIVCLLCIFNVNRQGWQHALIPDAALYGQPEMAAFFIALIPTIKE